MLAGTGNLERLQSNVMSDFKAMEAELLPKTGIISEGGGLPHSERRWVRQSLIKQCIQQAHLLLLSSNSIPANKNKLTVPGSGTGLKTS